MDEVATLPEGVTQDAPVESPDNDIAARLSSLIDDPLRQQDGPDDSREPAKADAQEDAAPETPAVQTVKVKIDGEEREVPLTDVVAKYQKDAAAEKRLEEASRARREVDEVAQRVHAERQQLAQALDTYMQRAQQFGPRPPDPKMLDADPVEYLRQEAAFKQAQQDYAQAQAAQAYLAQQQQAEMQTRYGQQLESERQALLKALPHWSDPAKAAKEKEMVSKHLTSLGFAPEQVQSLADHRLVVMAREAAMYRDLISRAKEAPKAVPKAPQRVERPGVAGTAIDGRSAAMQRLTRSGSVEDAAAVFRSLLG